MIVLLIIDTILLLALLVMMILKMKQEKPNEESCPVTSQENIKLDEEAEKLFTAHIDGFNQAMADTLREIREGVDGTRRKDTNKKV